jgi:predicted phage replisome organizer
MAEKRYFWIQIEKDFFRNKEIKFFKKIAGGDTYTVIYLKMLLKSIDNEGKLYFDGFEKTFAEELALDIDEEDKNVEFVVGYLISKGLLVEHNPEEYELTSFKSMVGSESASAARVRRHRAKKKALQSNAEETASNLLETERREEERREEKDEEVDVEDIENHNGGNSSFFDNLQKYLGRGLTFPESEQARAWREEQSEQMILKAVSIAALNRTTSFAYIDKIIRNWNNQGITTLAELEKHEENRERAKGKQPAYSKKVVKPAPEWSDPNPKVEMANPDEVKEIFDKYGIGNT